MPSSNTKEWIGCKVDPDAVQAQDCWEVLLMQAKYSLNSAQKSRQMKRGQKKLTKVRQDNAGQSHYPKTIWGHVHVELVTICCGWLQGRSDWCADGLRERERESRCGGNDGKIQSPGWEIWSLSLYMQTIWCTCRSFWKTKETVTELNRTTGEKVSS